MVFYYFDMEKKRLNYDAEINCRNNQAKEL